MRKVQYITNGFGNPVNYHVPGPMGNQFATRSAIRIGLMASAFLLEDFLVVSEIFLEASESLPLRFSQVLPKSVSAVCSTSLISPLSSNLLRASSRK